MSGEMRAFGISAVIPGLMIAALSGCGTSINSSSSSPSAPAQPQSVPASGPTLGYVWDATGQALRPVQGVPGASILGTAVISAPSAGAAFIATASSSVSGTAVFLDANGGVFQGSLAGGPLTRVANVPGSSSLVLSHSGTFVLVTGKDASGASNSSLITGLPQTPMVQSLNVSASAAILGGAASDTGSVALAVASGHGGGASIVAFAGKSAGTQVTAAQAFGGMQFIPGSDELVIADGASGVLTAISHVNSAPTAAVLSAAGGIASPVALDITPNSRWVVAANHRGDVLRIDLTGAAGAAKAHCSCAPIQVLALNGSTAGTTVRLVTAAGGPLWIMDAGNAAPQVMFVPALSVQATSTPGVSKPAL